jgi:hypothetical protein
MVTVTFVQHTSFFFQREPQLKITSIHRPEQRTTDFAITVEINKSCQQPI